MSDNKTESDWERRDREQRESVIAANNSIVKANEAQNARMEARAAQDAEFYAMQVAELQDVMRHRRAAEAKWEEHTDLWTRQVEALERIAKALNRGVIE